MTDRSQIAMLIGLVILVLVVVTLGPSISIVNPSFLFHSGILPWIAIALCFWFFFGKGGGCCGKKSDNEG